MIAELAIAGTLVGADAEFTAPEGIEFAIEVTGRHDLREELFRICKRESGGGVACGYADVGVHEDDAWAGRTAHRRAVAKGWLRPDECEAHARGEPSQWSTRGAFGLIAAYHVHRLEPWIGACVGPAQLDYPELAALAAIEFAEDVCERLDACDCDARTRLWVGPGTFDHRTYARQRASLQRQCGDQAPLQDWQIWADVAVVAYRFVAPWERLARADVRAVLRSLDWRSA